MKGNYHHFSVLINDNDMFIHKQSKLAITYYSMRQTDPFHFQIMLPLTRLSQISGPCFIGSHTTIQSHSNIHRHISEIL